MKKKLLKFGLKQILALVKSLALLTALSEKNKSKQWLESVH